MLRADGAGDGVEFAAGRDGLPEDPGGEDVLPVVMWRRSREEWLAAVRAETLMGLLGRLAELEKIRSNS